MKSEISAIEHQMKDMIILCDDIIDDSYLTTQDGRKLVDLLGKGLEKIKELRISRDKAIIRRDASEEKLKSLSKHKANLEANK